MSVIGRQSAADTPTTPKAKRIRRGVQIDHRTREGRLSLAVRATLTASCGGRPTALQELLITQAASLSVRLHELDGQVGKAGPTGTQREKIYTGLSNAYVRTIGQLLKLPSRPKRKVSAKAPPAPAPVQTLKDYLATLAAAGSE